MTEAARVVHHEARYTAPEKQPSAKSGRWWQLTLGIICMSMIANLQYGWTLFVNPIHDKHGWSISEIQFAFSVFVVVETWLVPFEGYLVDKIGPKAVGVVAGVMVALAWVINAYATSLGMLYLGAAVGGVGAGAVYGACVGNALKWFPDRRGLASGLTAMGFGAGSALTVFPDRQHDQVARLRGDLLQVRHRTGRGRVLRELVPQVARRGDPGVASGGARVPESSSAPRANSRRWKRSAPRCSGCCT